MNSTHYKSISIIWATLRGLHIHQVQINIVITKYLTKNLDIHEIIHDAQIETVDILEVDEIIIDQNNQRFRQTLPVLQNQLPISLFILRHTRKSLHKTN